LPLLDLYGQLKVCEWVQVFNFNFGELVFFEFIAIANVVFLVYFCS